LHGRDVKSARHPHLRAQECSPDVPLRLRIYLEQWPAEDPKHLIRQAERRGAGRGSVESETVEQAGAAGALQVALTAAV